MSSYPRVLFDFEKKSLSKIFFSLFTNCDLPLDLAKHDRGSEFPYLAIDFVSSVPVILPEHIPPETHTLALSARCFFYGFPIVLPDHIRYLYIDFITDDTSKLVSLFDRLPVSLEVLSIVQFVPISNPPPLLKFICLPRPDHSVAFLRGYAKTYFESIPSLVDIYFGLNFSGPVFTRDDVS